MDQKRFNDISSHFSEKSIIVIGDLMVDAYLWGDAERISPEAPVPVVFVKETTENPGGAGNVITNLRALGAKVHSIGVVGDDHVGKKLIQLLDAMGVDTGGILINEAITTAVKTRVIAHSQQVVRIDQESREEMSIEVGTQLKKVLLGKIGSCDAVIIEDYNKGLLTKDFIITIIETCQSKNIPVYVDPKKHNVDAYKHVRLFKPNYSEFIQCVPDGENDFVKSGNVLRKSLDAELLMVTRGKDGIALFTPSGLETIPTRARRVHDVSGAGDSVISTFTLADLCGATPLEAAQLANYAAGKVCEEVGVVPISLDALSEIINYHTSP